GAQPQFFDSSAALSQNRADIPADKSVETRDKDGNVTGEKDKEGYKTKYTYDEDGQVARIDYASGKKAERTGPGEWTVTDPYGNKETGKADIHMTPKGDCVIDRDGNKTIQHPDGSVDEVNKDKSELHTDSEGRVTDIKHTDGSTEK